MCNMFLLRLTCSSLQKSLRKYRSKKCYGNHYQGSVPESIYHSNHCWGSSMKTTVSKPPSLYLTWLGTCYKIGSSVVINVMFGVLHYNVSTAQLQNEFELNIWMLNPNQTKKYSSESKPNRTRTQIIFIVINLKPVIISVE